MASQVKRHSDEAFFKPKRVFPARDAKGFPIGKQQRRRQAENKKLNKLKIRHCEIGIPGICLRNKFLTWMHATKTRFMLTSADWQRAARACQPCHDFGESKSHKVMAKMVDDAIAKRKVNNAGNELED